MAGVAQKIRNNFWDYRLHVVPPPIRNPAAPQPMRCHQTYVSSKYLHPLFFKSPIFFFRCSGGHSKSVAMQPTQKKRAAVPPCRCRQKAISSFVIGAPQAAQASCFIFLSPTDGGKNPSQLSVPSTGSSPPRRPSHGCPQTCPISERAGRPPVLQKADEIIHNAGIAATMAAARLGHMNHLRLIALHLVGGEESTSISCSPSSPKISPSSHMTWMVRVIRLVKADILKLAVARLRIPQRQPVDRTRSLSQRYTQRP